MKRILVLLILAGFYQAAFAQGEFDPSNNKFRQLGNDLSTPNVYRNAAGKPGHMYWQQRADYQISIKLDDENQRISGTEYITYFNNSPDMLDYLWIQLDQNIRMKDNLGKISMPMQMYERTSPYYFGRMMSDFDGGFKLTRVEDSKGKSLDYTVNYTMMRIDLEKPLKPGEKFRFRIDWWYNVNDREKDGGGRSGMEYFSEDDNYIYTIAQFYPRMAVYDEVEGWQNKQFTGRSEFALVFGNFDVSITVPSDHKVAATGVLQNRSEVLSPGEQTLFKKAETSFDEPVIIFSEDQARKAIAQKAKGTKTWHFKAEDVRDFAFASSRRFIWDAMAVKFGDRNVLAMSMYPPEGNPLWEHYSTRVVAHTLKVYSSHTFDYPYPVAWSIHTDNIGMEYPMICFNGGRPEADGTYSERTKWGMIGVIIHEVGHNYFPMIVNSDERQWTWMDEGLNTFLQGLAEREWDHNHPSPKGRPRDIVPYMKGDISNISPIMTNGDLIMQFNSNAYAKPATGLNILRETIMGRELFDYAFKEYANQWMFKHPTPDDFFRIMEDASAVDLDWFWRGWFYTTDHVDISIEGMKVFTFNDGDPVKQAETKKEADEKMPEELTVQRNRQEFKSMVERDERMRDFYDSYDANNVSGSSIEQYQRSLDGMTDLEKELVRKNPYFVQLDFKNIGGLVMPLILRFNFNDGSSEIIRVPAEVWSHNNVSTSKVFVFEKQVETVELDPFLETADCDTENNYWPHRSVPSRFEMYKYNRRGGSNPMQEAGK